MCGEGDRDGPLEVLAGAVIECLDYGAFIRRYDGPGTLFYLDPPYWGCHLLAIIRNESRA